MQKEKHEILIRPGIPCSEDSLAEYNKVWADMDAGFIYFYAKLDKQQSQLLTNKKKCGTVSSKEKRICENYSTTKKKHLKK